MQLDKGGTWTMYNVQINGNMKKSSTTYSMPGKKVSVIEADSKQLKKIINVINKIEKNEEITIMDVKGLGGEQ